MFKPLRTFTIGLAVMATLVGVAPAPANALLPPKWRELTWQNGDTGYCLGVAGGDVTNGTPIIVWRCNGSTDQMWTVDIIAQNGRPPFLVRNGTNRNKCLSVANDSRDNGAWMVIWDCKPLETSQDQRWLFSHGVKLGCTIFTNWNSGKVMGVSGGSRSEGAKVIQWDNLGHPDQEWCLTEVPVS